MLTLIITIIIIIITAIITIETYRFYVNRRLKWIPGPVGRPIFGSALDFGTNPVELRNKIVQLMNDYGSLTKVWIAHRVFILMADPDDIEKVLNSKKCIDKSVDYDFFRAWLGDSLLLTTGHKWRHRRKMLTPAFHFSILNKYVDVFNETANILIRNLAEHVDGPVFDIYPFVTMCALDNVCETTMGIKLNGQTNPNAQYVACLRRVCEIISIRTFSSWKQFDCLFELSNDGREEKRCLKVLHAFTDGVIRERKQLLVGQLNDDDEKIRTFLDILLTCHVDGRPLTNREIREEVDTFMFEGHDTISSAVTFALYLLAKNPQHQVNVYDEITRVLADKIEPYTLNHLKQLKYLEMVVKETLRMFPAIPFIARKVAEDFDLGPGKGVIPKGANIAIQFLTLHHNPRVFADPHAFKPERFADDVAFVNPYSYIPFSAGSRNCIGQRYAMAEIKLMLAKIIHAYEVILSDNPAHAIQPAVAIVMKSMSGIHVKLRLRTSC